MAVTLQYNKIGNKYWSANYKGFQQNFSIQKLGYNQARKEAKKYYEYLKENHK